MTRILSLYLPGSPAEKADLEVADEILEVNGESLENSNHTDVITHIHNVSTIKNWSKTWEAAKLSSFLVHQVEDHMLEGETKNEQ